MNADTPDRSAPDEQPRKIRTYSRGRAHRLENIVMSALVRAGLVPHTHLLTTRGRHTGRPRTNPVTVVQHDDRRWLVAPYGSVPWVHNARAAGHVRLTRRFRNHDYSVREISAHEAGPVLKHYVAVASATRDYFHAEKNAPAEVFEAEAHLHPAFELGPPAPSE
ncbi:nitroreductase family deazaflavin-dependent oxidoreductase [Rhodococcus sp. NPDC058639]|uniref:nitroreductase family deazaflavin-dependent oxidoreductase n=1 Tax=Rhodococcus sp. NPDC058639 TaxID=3346570 RepID=UPI00366707F8